MVRASRTAAQRQGDAGEAAAATYLIAQGLAIVTRNFRTRLGEIDLVARDGETLVFVEVRSRTNANCGGAAASITATKRARLKAAAGLYLARLGREPPCRFDAVLLEGNDASRIRWERDIVND